MIDDLKQILVALWPSFKAPIIGMLAISVASGLLKLVACLPNKQPTYNEATGGVYCFDNEPKNWARFKTKRTRKQTKQTRKPKHA